MKEWVLLSDAMVADTEKLKQYEEPSSTLPRYRRRSEVSERSGDDKKAKGRRGRLPYKW